jgi:hypothetical protein
LPSDPDDPLLERLPQSVEGQRGKLTELIEE